MVKYLIGFIDWILYTSLLTATCATGLYMATEKIIRQRNGIAGLIIQGNKFHLLIFGGTLLIYNTPRLVPKPYGKIRKTRPHLEWYILFFSLGLIAVLYSCYYLPPMVIKQIAVLGLISVAYYLPLLPFKEKRRLRDFGWLKIFVLTIIWTMVTCILPIIVYNYNPINYPFEILERLLFIFTLCIVFDIRDIKTDIGNNIYTLPGRLGLKNSYKLINVALGLYATVNLVRFAQQHITGGLMAGLITALITRFVISYLKNHPSDRAYNAMADGVMLIYAILVLAL